MPQPNVLLRLEIYVQCPGHRVKKKDTWVKTHSTKRKVNMFLSIFSQSTTNANHPPHFTFCFSALQTLAMLPLPFYPGSQRPSTSTSHQPPSICTNISSSPRNSVMRRVSCPCHSCQVCFSPLDVVSRRLFIQDPGQSELSATLAKLRGRKGITVRDFFYLQSSVNSSSRVPFCRKLSNLPHCNTRRYLPLTLTPPLRLIAHAHSA